MYADSGLTQTIHHSNATSQRPTPLDITYGTLLQNHHTDNNTDVPRNIGMQQKPPKYLLKTSQNTLHRPLL
ncbi:hypothetical protein DF22_001986 [Xylella fastidiosa]|nr:hypothetical protein P303_07620 [Xylella fastidiosa MUL0034]EWG15085.1 hypothetical protein P910_001384 [Xylella fastidiosa Mul-MD]KFA41407.1 hypothetical protein DF22_001986 [Xylella fastidiosa]